MKKIAILQPNYIPWKGVFDLINRVDTFVFFDDVQYTKKDWRNRNKIKTKEGDIWLTIPVITKGKKDQLILEAMIQPDTKWQEKHYQTIVNNYKNAKYFDKSHHILEEIYLNKEWENLCELNIFSTKLIAEVLGIDVSWVRSSDLELHGDKSGERVVKICKKLDCNYFINGPASRQFMNEELFRENGIRLEYMEYNYREYEQMYKPFSHNVTVLDTIFNCGDQAPKYIFEKVEDD